MVMRKTVQMMLRGARLSELSQGRRWIMEHARITTEISSAIIALWQERRRYSDIFFNAECL